MSTPLYKTPFFANVWIGTGTVLDLMPFPKHHDFIPGILERCDEDTLWSDWAVVGDDLRGAMDTLARDYGIKEQTTPSGDHVACFTTSCEKNAADSAR